ncbi:hypothetical protein B0H34DRAFT_675358 [Crassisporium funariophilum]|nr:hypothetical protein B0H34DRAFT_675358 [Crassisporium funariophilum]
MTINQISSNAMLVITIIRPGVIVAEAIDTIYADDSTMPSEHRRLFNHIIGIVLQFDTSAMSEIREGRDETTSEHVGVAEMKCGGGIQPNGDRGESTDYVLAALNIACAATDMYHGAVMINSSISRRDEQEESARLYYGATMINISVRLVWADNHPAYTLSAVLYYISNQPPTSPIIFNMWDVQYPRHTVARFRIPATNWNVPGNAVRDAGHSYPEYMQRYVARKQASRREEITTIANSDRYSSFSHGDPSENNRGVNKSTPATTAQGQTRTGITTPTPTLSQSPRSQPSQKGPREHGIRAKGPKWDQAEKGHSCFVVGWGLHT